MAGIVFVSVTEIQKNVQQAELDGTAKELFVVAQNHLSTAESQGLLDRFKENVNDSNADSIVGIPEGEGSSVYYFAVGDDTSHGLLNNGNNVLGQMLPFGSIADTVRIGGTYVIRYDLDAAKVLDVFYANKTSTSLFGASTGGKSFSAGDCPGIIDYAGPDQKMNRRSYPLSGANVMIGWFGGEEANSLPKTVLPQPTLRVENAERLVAKVTLPTTSPQLTLTLIVTGEDSKKSKAFELNGVSRPSNVWAETNGLYYEVVLDDITNQANHFATLFGGDGFIPGENISVQVVASSKSALATVKKSAKVHRNSLFGSVNTATNVTRVSNIRHLENLSADVSNYAPTQTGITVKQTNDLSWTDFKQKVSGGSVCSYSTSVNLNAGDGFAPVYPKDSLGTDYALTYDGGGHRISDVTITRAGTAGGNAGLFDTLANNSSISDLTLANFDVSTTSGNAGALAGNANGTTISNVLAFNEVAGGDDSAYEITGTASAGGLVGSMDGGSISGSAAALYVNAGSGGDAGGLVGKANGTTIETSYAGGHTVEGQFANESAGAGRYNIIGSNAGGLVGNASGDDFMIQNCYATVSVSGSATAGGLVGTASAGAISGSYTASKVFGAGSLGTFVGDHGIMPGAGTAYFSLVNYGTEMEGDVLGSAVAADSDLTNYRTNAEGTNAAAYPYDGTLKTHYNNTDYPFKTIANLVGSGTGLAAHSSVHYGDWPSLETFVINQ